ncbi:uncharacterized protein [Miscanthus floridulus]|uniref:uncharacterized protein n=1 Tax=Miscanthus floridulus TaxID=154761 RepID=UPI00345980EF
MKEQMLNLNSRMEPLQKRQLALPRIEPLEPHPPPPPPPQNRLNPPQSSLNPAQILPSASDPFPPRADLSTGGSLASGLGCCCGGASPPAGGQRLLPAEQPSPGAGGPATAAVADEGFVTAGVPAAAHPLLSSPPSRKGGAGLGASTATSSRLLASPGRPTLSPDAASFFPGHLSAGKSKRLRWEDGSLSGDSNLERSPSPSLQAARLTRSGAAPSSASPPPMAVAVVAAIPVPQRRRQRRRRHRRRWQRVATAATGDCDAPRRGGAAPPSEAPWIPVQLRLGPRSRVSALDADGWRCILPRSPNHPVGN